MIERLRITNLAIIEELELELSNGFVTVTGETGAGKSILLNAVRLALGERASADTIRTGESRAQVEVIFRVEGTGVLPLLDQAGLANADDPDLMVVRREITASGGSRAFVNGFSVTLAQLRDVVRPLVDIHGQYDNASLLAQEHQLWLLDQHGGHGRLLADYGAAYAAFLEALGELRRLLSVNADAEQRRSFLEFQISEIRAASLSPGEDEQLQLERTRLANAETLQIAAASASDLLYEGENTEIPAAALLASAAEELEKIAAVDDSQRRLADRAEELRFAVSDLAADVRQYASQIAADPNRLEWLDERLQAIKDLKRKYGKTIEDILESENKFAKELEEIVNRDEAIASARAECGRAAERLRAHAEELSAVRRKSAVRFEKEIARELTDLELPKAAFSVQFVAVGAPAPDSLDAAAEGPWADVLRFTPTGAETVEYLVSLNPGEESRPLRRIASGGEIARIMLAIKSVLAERDEVPTLVFDEIDVGISGEAATRVGRKLRALGKSHQVLCVTHLAQVAALGDRHLAVRKQVAKGRTRVRVEPLTGEAREQALAEMLAGKSVGSESLEFARTLLNRGSAEAAAE